MKSIFFVMALIVSSYMTLSSSQVLGEEVTKQTDLPTLDTTVPAEEIEKQQEEVASEEVKEEEAKDEAIASAITSKPAATEEVEAQKTLAPVKLKPLNVDGKYKAPVVVATPRPMTASDRLRNTRMALEKRNEMMIKRKIEELRVRQELIMMKQVEKAMNQTMKAMDQI